MSWFSKIIGNKEAEKMPEPKQNSSENKPDGLILEGLGSSKTVIQDVYKIQRDKLFEWRERYSKEEYPYKVVINIIYQLLQLEFMWNEIHKCFNQNIKRIDDYNFAYNFVMKLKEVAISNISAKVDQTYNSRDLIGNFDLKLFRKMVADAQKGNNEQMAKIEQSYLWYTGGVELMYHWAACGLMGLNHFQAASEVCSMVMSIDYKNLSDMQTMFGNNINMEYKLLPRFSDNKDFAKEIVTLKENKSNLPNTEKANKSKRCEYCGKESNNYLYGMVIIPTLKINLLHPEIIENDKKNQTIILKDNTRIDYSWQISNNVALAFSLVQPHVFCSDTCIYEFKNYYKLKYMPDNQKLIENFEEMGLFLPEVINPNNQYFIHNSKCLYCNSDFHNGSKDFHIAKILKSTKISSDINSSPPNMPEFDIAHSDLNKKNPNGYWYFYKCDFQNLISAQFCSNDCAYMYSKEHNSYIAFKNNFEGIHLGIIVPELIEINKALGNKYILRPIRSQIQLDDSNKNLKKESKNFIKSDQPANEMIRFLNGQIEFVEYKFDGIWMKPVSEILIEDELMVAFMPDFQIQFPTLKDGVPSIYKKTIEFAHKLSQGAYFKFDNYIYPDFDALIKEKKTDENRLTDEVKNQILQLVSFIINQYSILRNFQQNYSKNDLTFNHLLVNIVNLIFKKDSKFERKNLYYNTQFYLHPIEDEFIEKIIQKAQLDFKTLKENNQGVYQPHGSRDEEEIILSYIDAIVLREFFLNHFKSQIETMNYFNFVPDLVEDLYQNIITSKSENHNFIDDDIPF